MSLLNQNDGAVAMASFDLLNGEEGMVSGVGRRGSGALVRSASGTLDSRGNYNYSIATNLQSTDDPYFTIDHFALKGGDSGVWADDGISLLTHTGNNGTDYILTLTTGSSGDLELWRYLNNSGGTKGLIATISGVLPDPDTYVYLQYRVDWDATDCTVTIKDGTGTTLWSGATGVGRDPDDRTRHYFLHDYYDGTPTVFGVYIDDAVSIDSRGSINNTYLGDLIVNVLTTYSTVEFGVFNEPWHSTNPDNDPYLQLDDIPPDDDTTYIYNTDDATTFPFLFDFQKISPDDSTPIAGVAFHMRAKSTSSPSSSIKFRIKDVVSGDTYDEFSSHGYGDFAYDIHHIGYEYDPTVGGWASTTPWTAASVNDLAFGGVLQSSSNRVRVTALYIEYISAIPQQVDIWALPVGSTYGFEFGENVLRWNTLSLTWDQYAVGGDFPPTANRLIEMYPNALHHYPDRIVTPDGKQMIPGMQLLVRDDDDRDANIAYWQNSDYTVRLHSTDPSVNDTTNEFPALYSLAPDTDDPAHAFFFTGGVDGVFMGYYPGSGTAWSGFDLPQTTDWAFYTLTGDISGWDDVPNNLVRGYDSGGAISRLGTFTHYIFYHAGAYWFLGNFSWFTHDITGTKHDTSPISMLFKLPDGVRPVDANDVSTGALQKIFTTYKTAPTVDHSVTIGCCQAHTPVAWPGHDAYWIGIAKSSYLQVAGSGYTQGATDLDFVYLLDSSGDLHPALAATWDTGGGEDSFLAYGVYYHAPSNNVFAFHGTGTDFAWSGSPQFHGYHDKLHVSRLVSFTAPSTFVWEEVASISVDVDTGDYHLYEHFSVTGNDTDLFIWWTISDLSGDFIHRLHLADYSWDVWYDADMLGSGEGFVFLRVDATTIAAIRRMMWGGVVG